MNVSALTLTCLSDVAAFRALREEWQELHASCPEATPFNSWEWLYSWWQAYGEARALRLLAWRADGALVGVAPLYLATEKTVLGARAQVLRMVGDGSGDSDYLAFLLHPAFAQPMMTQLGRWLVSEASWDAFKLSELKVSEEFLNGLGELARQSRFALRLTAGRCSAIDLPATLSEFLRARQPRFRTRIRSLLRKMNSDPSLRFDSCNEPGDLRARLRSLFALHQARWATEGAVGVFGDLRRRRFYARFAPRFARRGWLRFYSLRRGQRYVAHQLCFGFGGVTYLLQEGFDASDASASYGQTLRAAVIRELVARGERRYDFLGGYSRHKADWGARAAETASAVIARGRWRGRVYADMPLWRERFAGAANRLLPPIAVRILKRTRDLVA